MAEILPAPPESARENLAQDVSIQGAIEGSSCQKMISAQYYSG